MQWKPPQSTPNGPAPEPGISHPQWQQPQAYWTPSPQTIPPRQPHASRLPHNVFFAGVGLLVVIFIGIGISFAGYQSVSVSPASSSAQVTPNTNTTTGNQATSIPTSEATKPASSSSGLGSSQTSGPWTVTVNSVKPTTGGPYDDAPKPGDIYILINFTARNMDSRVHDMAASWFTLRDDRGNTYDPVYITVPSQPRGMLVGGQQLRGDLSYEIPKTLHSLVLQFDSPDDFSNSQVERWNLQA